VDYEALRRRPEWHAQAKCIGLTDVMFATDEFSQLRARQICRDCPVAVPCLVAAFDRREPDGIWGGLSYEEREAIRKRRSL
jgi:WhiB family redox-sensing transcriptional regulator